MAFVELKPKSGTADFIRIAPRRGGGISVAIGAETLSRNRLGKAQRVRVLVDATAMPRLLRIARDDKGPWEIRRTKAGTGVLALPWPQGLPAATFDKALCEFDEHAEPGGDCIDVELPRELQRREAVSHQPVGNGAIQSAKPVSLPRVGR